MAETIQGSDWYPAFSMQIVKNRSAPSGRDSPIATTQPASTPPACTHRHIKLEKQFNALNLHRIAGIRIFWTDNLADHLRMMNDDKTVAIFYHASFLEYQKHKYVHPKSTKI